VFLIIKINTSWTTEGFGVRFLVGVKKFKFYMSSRAALGLIPKGTGEALSPRVKRQGREADQSSRTIAEVKEMWVYTWLGA
jgi:hypothetical protein